MSSGSETRVFPSDVLARAVAVRVAIFDVDGVLTDGGLYFDERGESLKRFHTLDGLGLKLLQQAGVTVVVISGRDSKPLRLRLSALGLQHVHLGVEHKLPFAEAMLQSLGFSWAALAVMGDDWPDLPLLVRCALPVAPPSAHVEVRARALHVTQAAAGAGAVRECCDVILQARGLYATLLAQAVDGLPPSAHV